MYKCSHLDEDLLNITTEFLKNSLKSNPRPEWRFSPCSSQDLLFQASVFILLGYGVNQIQPRHTPWTDLSNKSSLPSALAACTLGSNQLITAPSLFFITALKPLVRIRYEEPSAVREQWIS